MTINVDPRVHPICVFCIHWISHLNTHLYSLLKNSGPPAKGIRYVPPGIQHNIMRIRMLLVQLVVGTITLSFLINLSAPDAYDFLKQQISSALWRNILVLGLVVGAICVYAGVEVREKKNKKKRVFVRRLCQVQKIQTTPKRRTTKKNASDCNGTTPRERSATTCPREVTEGLHPQGPVGTVYEEADTKTLHPNGLLHPVDPVHRNTTADKARGEDTEGLHPEGSVGPVHEDADNGDFHPNGTPGRRESETEGLHPVGTVHQGADKEALHPSGMASSGPVESDIEGLHSVYPVHRNRTAATARGEDTEGSHREVPIGTIHNEADKEALHSNCTASRELYTEDLHPEVTVVIEPGDATEHLRREGTVTTVLGEEPESSHHGDLRSSPAAELEMVASTLAREVFGQYSIERGWQDSVSESLPSLPHPARQISPPRGWRFMGIFRFLQKTRTSAPLAPSVALVTVGFMATTIPTNQPVPGVEAASESDLTLTSSKVVYKWLDIGPENASDQIDRLTLQIIKSMSEAREIDEDSNLQIGSFAVLKYTDTGPKWWRLQGHSIPTILSVHRHPWRLLDLLYGLHAKWSIRGFNLQDSQLKVSTVDEKEDLNTLHHEKMVSGEEVLFCEESHLVRKFALWFQKDVYIFATKSVEVEKGVKVTVQSKPNGHVKRTYWGSVVQGLVPNVWAIIIMASFSLANITNVGFNLEGTRFSTVVLGKLYSFLVYVFSYSILVFVLTLWRVTHGGLRPAGDNVPSSQTCVPFEVLSNSLSPTSLLHEEGESMSTDLNEGVEEEEGVDIPGPRAAPSFEGVSKTYNRMLQLPDQDQAQVIKMDLDIKEEHQKEGDDAPGGQTATASEFVDEKDSTLTSIQLHNDDVNIEDREREKGDDVPNLRTTARTEDLDTTEDLNTSSNPTSAFACENEVMEMNVNIKPEEEGPSPYDSGAVSPQITSIDTEKTDGGEPENVIDVFQFSYTGSASVDSRERLEEQPGTPHPEIELEDEEPGEKQYFISSPSCLDIAWEGKLDRLSSLVQEDQLFRWIAAQGKTKLKVMQGMRQMKEGSAGKVMGLRNRIPKSLKGKAKVQDTIVKATRQVLQEISSPTENQLLKSSREAFEEISNQARETPVESRQQVFPEEISNEAVETLVRALVTASQEVSEETSHQAEEILVEASREVSSQEILKEAEETLVTGRQEVLEETYTQSEETLVPASRDLVRNHSIPVLKKNTQWRKKMWPSSWSAGDFAEKKIEKNEFHAEDLRLLLAGEGKLMKTDVTTKQEEEGEAYEADGLRVLQRLQGPVGPIASPEGQQHPIGTGYVYTQHTDPVSGGVHGNFPPYLPGTTAMGHPALQGQQLGPHKETIFPERSGQPECQYYMKTGDCKFGIMCKYHHPKDRATPSPTCGLSRMGLPLRPEYL